MGNIEYIVEDSGLVTFKIKPTVLNLEKTLFCGQAFRWKKLDSPNGQFQAVGVARHRIIHLIQDFEDGVIHTNLKEEEVQEFIEYFNLELDYDAILDFRRTEYEDKCIENNKGLRILKQDMLETIISFIFSQRNTIERISRTVNTFAVYYGKYIEGEGINGELFMDFDFPDWEYIKKLVDNFTENDHKIFLEELKLGYRAKYLEKTLPLLLKHRSMIEKIEHRSPEEARNSVYIDVRTLSETFLGVGEKVASCVLLFGANNYAAFPVDVHIQRVLDRHYSESSISTRPWYKYRGIMQQYMFIVEQQNQFE